MSLASEPDHPKADIATASNIEAVITVTSVLETETDQQSSGQQTPIADDAIVVAEPPPPELSPASRPRRARSSLPVYNLSKLTGTDVHGKRKSKGDTVLEKRRRTISDGTTANFGDLDAIKLGDALAKASQTTKIEVDASRVKRSSAVLHTPKSARIAKKSSLSPAPAHLTRRATRLSGASAETLTSKLSSLSKRGKKAVEKAVSKLPRELLRLKDTNEFAHIDTRPVRYTVWSNGKYIEVDPSQETPAPQPPRKKAKVDEDAVNGEEKPAEEEQKAAAPAVKKPRVKKWLEKGLYAGQEAPLDIFKGLNAQEKKKLAALPELLPSGKPNHTFPQPMYNGLRVLINGRDFKLPFDVCNPLPPGQPKPAAYRTMTKSEFLCQPDGII
jgi:histone-lysine N-methyltransferase ASH1L